MKEITIGTDELKRISSFVASAEDKLNKQASYEKVASSELEGLVDGLVSAGLIEANLKEASVTAMTNDPVQVIEVLKQACDHLALTNSAGEGTKEAGVAELTADQRFNKILMGQ